MQSVIAENRKRPGHCCKDVFVHWKSAIAEFRDRFDDFDLQASELCGQGTEYINKTIRDVGDAETKQYDEFDNDSDDQPKSGRLIMRVDCFNVIIVDCRAEQAKASLR